MIRRTVRLTVAQAVVRFLANQWTERDGVEQRAIPGCFGIFGHGNVAGIGQALLEAQRTGSADLPYYLARNEQAMVHASVGFARMRNRLSTMACTASIGPGLHEHAHRRGAGHDEPDAGAAAAQRRVRHPRRRARCCRSWRTRARTTSASTTRSARCRGSSTGSGGPSSCRRRCWARCGCSPTRSRPAPSPSRCRRTCRPRRTTGRDELFAQAGLARRPPAGRSRRRSAGRGRHPRGRGGRCSSPAAA